jgi:hypothetical protein
MSALVRALPARSTHIRAMSPRQPKRSLTRQLVRKMSATYALQVSAIRTVNVYIDPKAVQKPG